MENILDFILARYNYWIFITLMMTGLYIVISRGNLVKTLIGLNLFQTSVFIFYISIGKIAGGTAPILIGGEEAGHGDGHGADHGEGASHGATAAHGAESAHAAPQDQSHEANSLEADTGAHGTEETGHGGELHSVDGVDLPSNSLAPAPPPTPGEALPADQLHEVRGLLESTGQETSLAEAARSGAEIIYTNPLPHVLILTAIVVGVATTAVGLALAVRIREAYGTIEEDELEAEDHIAEFGVPLGTGQPTKGAA